MANGYERRLIRVWDHISGPPFWDLPPDALAAVAALLRFHFHRVFYTRTGQAVAQAVRWLRLFRASVLLLDRSVPLEEVSRRIGYDRAKSFARAFRARAEQRPPPLTFSGL